MKTKQQKVDSLKQLEADLEGSKMTVFTSYAKEGEKGLSVAKMRELKKGLLAVHSKYTVVKKTILDRALKAGKVQDVNTQSLTGSLGLALGNGDEASTAKAVYSFSRTNPALKLFGALIGEKFIDAVQFVELAKLPAREVMIGRTVGMIKYPISGLVNVLQGNIRNLVLVLSAVNKSKS